MSFCFSTYVATVQACEIGTGNSPRLVFHRVRGDVPDWRAACACLCAASKGVNFFLGPEGSRKAQCPDLISFRCSTNLAVMVAMWRRFSAGDTAVNCGLTGNWRQLPSDLRTI